MVMTGASYVSAIIDPNGRQIAVDRLLSRWPACVVADVPMGSGATTYTPLGDVLGWVALIGFLFFIVFQSITNQRAKKGKTTLQASGSSAE